MRATGGEKGISGATTACLLGQCARVDYDGAAVERPPSACCNLFDCVAVRMLTMGGSEGGGSTEGEGLEGGRVRQAGFIGCSGVVIFADTYIKKAPIWVPFLTARLWPVGLVSSSFWSWSFHPNPFS